jgi:hypothetical protein
MGRVYGKYGDRPIAIEEIPPPRIDRNPTIFKEENFEALLDSASDVTIFPQDILAMLGVKVVDSVFSGGVFGTLQT